MPWMEAGVIATRKIAMAVMDTTLSLVIIFNPIAFMSGYARRFLNQFGWTMAMSILVSMLVAFTLTPTLSARLLRKKRNGNKAVHKHGMFDGIYVAALEWSLRHRWVVVTTSVLVFASTFVVNRYIGRDWMPQDDQNELMVYAELPEGSSVEATEKFSLELGKKLEKTPGVISVLPQSSARYPRINASFSTVLLEDADKRGTIDQMAA